MGTSTGGTLALQLVAGYPDKIAALVLLSPNIAINDPNARGCSTITGVFRSPAWCPAGKYIDVKEDYGPLYRQYWYPGKYRLEAAERAGRVARDNDE